MEITNFSKDKKQRRKPGIDLSTMVYGKVPPQARELEEAVLGGCMLMRGAFDTALEILKPESFYTDAHQVIFKAYIELSQRSSPIDMLTVVEQLKRSEELDMIGGPYYITKLTNAVVSGAHIEEHARIIQQKFISRELIRIGGEIISDAYEDSTDVFNLLDKAEAAIYEVLKIKFHNDFKMLGAGVVAMLEKIEELKRQDTNVTGVPSGFKEMDRITHGFQETDFILLAARPSVGKTALALTIAKNAATNILKPTPVGFFSLEMDMRQLLLRVTSADSGIRLDNFFNGRILDMDRLMRSADRITQLPIYVDDTAALSIFEFRAKARRMVAKFGVRLILIDYLQLMSGDSERGGNREQEISKISRSIKAVAKELKIPIIALSQLSRAVESRKGAEKEPQLSDLRESGALEQDADVVMFIYQPGQEAVDSHIELANRRMVKIAKHRNGSLGKLAFEVDNSIQLWSEIGVLNTGAVYADPRDETPTPVRLQVGSRMAPEPEDDEELPF
jgi:replicative DNA helicase